MMGNFLPRKTSVIKTQTQEYLHYCEFNRRFTPDTLRTKRQTINKFLTDHPRLTDFRKLTNEELDIWLTDMVKAGKAGKTVNNYGDHVMACLRYLQNKRGEKLRIRLEAVERCEEDPAGAPHFSHGEVEQIKSACQGPREFLLVSLIFESALRIQEVNNLKVENIKDCEITIVGKGRKKRTVFMLEETRKLLDQWMLITSIEEGYIFPSPMKFGDSLSVQQVRSSINAPIRRAGFETGSAHAIRKASLTTLLDRGLSLQDTALYAGHSNPQTTLKHYYLVKNKELGSRVTQAFAGSSA